MSEYIKKSELLETLEEFKPDINDFDWTNAECEHIQKERYQAKLDMFMDLISIIERIPTADADEPEKAKKCTNYNRCLLEDSPENLDIVKIRRQYEEEKNRAESEDTGNE